ncbi:NAD(P)H-binding protein [Streptomyces sp. CC208A]|uniref:SDR family oxidoreductase n=1 Tax=Streptomyces sp. CC208A TaxID=3044573 RepID=UPI0024A90D41|nr:NAD(P)H-binding protein [Streptomyces sp. CC208A]
MTTGTKTILVTGATGTLGRPLCARLAADGHEVRELSRRSRTYPVDLRRGTGLDEALAGVHTVVHCATAPRGGDEEAARNLIAAARRAGVRHLVYVSIVGVDRVPLGYYRTKLAVERLVEGSGLGWTVLRATQFHDLVVQVLAAAAKVPWVMPVPAGVSDQPVDVGEVADRLAVLAAGPPAGRAPDMGGPEIRTFTELARAYLAASGRRRKVLAVPLAGRVYRAFRAGGHLTPTHATGARTFAQYLRERPPAP